MEKHSAQEVSPMQVEGMREFFSKVALWNGNPVVRSSTFLPALPAPTPQARPARDSLLLSDLGKKLSLTLSEKESSSLIERPTADPADSLPSWAQPLDKALSKTIDIMEKMQKLAVAAQDKKLTDLDRIEMQIEVEDLKSNLMLVPRDLRGAPPLSPDGKIFLLEGHDPLGDYSSALERARDRILNGQEWDVREAWCTDGFTRMAQDENGEEVLEVFAGKTWYVVDDRNVLTKLLHETEFRDSGRKVPTLRERLKGASPVVVMDAQSAAEGAGYLENRIASVRKFREQLPDLIKRPRDPLEETCAFLEPLLSDFKESLSSPDIAHYFLFEDGIYGLQHVTRRVVKPDDSDPSLVDSKSLEDKGGATDGASESGDTAQAYSVARLREEAITLLTPKVVKTVHIKGFSKQRE